MQTFLPYPSFISSASTLDRARLGKQRVEAKQILMALRGESSGWLEHPATKMWRGHECALANYGRDMCMEWIGRGYKDTLRPYFDAAIRGYSDSTPPGWLGDDAFHASHRSNLLRKDATHYSRFGWTEPHDLPYVWPV